MTDAVELLKDFANGGIERKAARESAVLELSGLMSGAPVSREQVRKAPEPENEDEKNKQIVKAFLELRARIGEGEIKRLILEIQEGTPSSDMQLSGEQRNQAVMSLANAVKNELAGGR